MASLPLNMNGSESRVKPSPCDRWERCGRGPTRRATATIARNPAVDRVMVKWMVTLAASLVSGTLIPSGFMVM
eukprot:scaffold2295_cov128-Isochrysis_galbana.AAC.1